MSELTAEIKTELDKMTASNDVVIFMKGTPDMPMCGFSARAVACFGQVGVTPAEIHGYNILENREISPAINEYADWPTYPKIYVKGEFIGGGDILHEMLEDGELKSLLVEKGVI